jgi:hypothetical protein
MAPIRRALLIASPYGQLKGTEYDVERMSEVLEDHGFQITYCCGEKATRSGILAAWERLIQETQEDDAVVIYYSGHGGEVVDETIRPQNAHLSEQRELRTFFDAGVPWRYQFLVPVDYKDDPENFRGILDAEISQLLRDTTGRTKNVTIILDCCHAGRMAREPRYPGRAVRKNIGRVHHYNVSKYVETLRANGAIKPLPIVESNEHAVRICAAAPFETANEYDDADGHPAGVLTDSLIQALEGVKESGAKVSWRTLMFRVQEIVKVFFPSQHPLVEGPHTRYLFSTESNDLQGYAIRMEDTKITTRSGKPAKVVKLQAGTFAGIRTRDVFCVMPAGWERPDSSERIAEATVTDVSGFDSIVSLRYQNGKSHVPEGAVAFLETRALSRWPAQFPDTLGALRPRIQASKFLDVWKKGEKPLVRFEHRDNEIILKNARGLTVGSRPLTSPVSYGALVKAAETLARAHHFLSLRSELPREKLQHNLDYEIGLVDSGRRGKLIPLDGTGRVAMDEFIFFTLRNLGSQEIFVSVFDVEVSGRITHVSNSHGTGIYLQPGAHQAIGYEGKIYTGKKVTWPTGVPWDSGPVEETLVFVVTSQQVDLRFLDTNEAGGLTRSNARPSEGSPLSNLFYNMSQGVGRGVEDPPETVDIRYDILHFPFQIVPKEGSDGD